MLRCHIWVVMLKIFRSTGLESKKPLQARLEAALLVFFRPDLVAGARFELATFGL